MFKSLEIKKSAIHKISSGHGELNKSDVEGQIKSLIPGEWILLKDVEGKKLYIGFANPLVADKIPAIRVLKKLSSPPKSDLVEELISARIKKSYDARLKYKGYENGCRVVFGESDGLPGLIIDSYENCTLIQINSAGMDKWREHIKSTVLEIIKRPVCFLDNPQQRIKEVLPHFREELSVEKISISENNFSYEIPAKNLQKIGWYYDHRENRNKFESVLTKYNGSKEKGLDLFCYGGSWGLHQLRGGVKSVEFVDQAPLQEIIENHLEINKFNNRGSFQRADVFKWLDEAISSKKKFNIIACDPPAFAKSKKDKLAAIEGYKKLHRKVFKVADESCLIAFASCTHYISLEEFQETIIYSAKQENRELNILELGMQGWDHPVSSFHDRANYIKYILVRIE
ncbi:MAG: class I SAM-dependent methyltransferase [Bacteriovoracaceae bacterium]|nr:class I SAM-dependent methyltransferase [Bacteriovoracaceae bacterium]